MSCDPDQIFYEKQKNFDRSGEKIRFYLSGKSMFTLIPIDNETKEDSYVTKVSQVIVITHRILPKLILYFGDFHRFRKPNFEFEPVCFRQMGSD